MFCGSGDEHFIRRVERAQCDGLFRDRNAVFFCERDDDGAGDAGEDTVVNRRGDDAMFLDDEEICRGTFQDMSVVVVDDFHGVFAQTLFLKAERLNVVYGFERCVGALIIFGDDFCTGFVETRCGKIGHEVMHKDVEGGCVRQEDARGALTAGNDDADDDFGVRGVAGDEIIGDREELRIGDGWRETQKLRATDKALPVRPRIKKASLCRDHKVKNRVAAQHPQIVRAQVQIFLFSNGAVAVAVLCNVRHSRILWDYGAVIHYTIPSARPAGHHLQNRQSLLR